MHHIDAWQQRSPWASPAFGVIRKFGDDRGPSLAALLTYYSFLALFPMLLVMATILGYIGNERIAQSVLGSALEQFPVVGEQLGRDAAQPLHGSPLALTVGIVGSLYGSLGATQVAQRIMADVWNVPNVVRPGFVPRLGRSLGVLGLLALATVVGAGAGLVTGSVDTTLLARTGTLLLVTAIHVVFFALILRVLTPKQVPSRDLRAGSVVGGVGYTALLAIGSALVQHQLRHAEALYGQFGFVLGLLGWLYLLAQLAIYAGEINVVLKRRLWPRSLIQPPLTRADEEVLSAIAQQEERRPEQTVAVAFESPPPDDGGDP
ncbi:MAG: putative ribonuclease [Ilumatobacteraceae bacterium]|nr:putative ribonuclease [Ilumatobacteraceae bacterium]